MRPRRGPRPTCRRKGCNAAMRRSDTFCAGCWSLVSRRTRHAIIAAGRARDAAALTGHWRTASDEVAHARADRSTRTYANHARLLGERDDQEAAE